MGTSKKTFQIITFALLLWHPLLIVMTSCGRNTHESSPYVYIEGDTLYFFASMCVNYKDFHEENLYYRNDAVLVNIMSQNYNNKWQNDTLMYLFAGDSILDCNTNAYYLVDSGLIVSAHGIPHAIGSFNYRYTDRRLTHISVINDLDTIHDDYNWIGNKIDNNLHYHNSQCNKYEFIYNDKDAYHRAKDGGLGYYIECFGWECVPLVLLGYYGDIPQYNLTAVKSYCKSSTEQHVYENHFDKNNRINKIYLPVRSTTIDFNFGDTHH